MKRLWLRMTESYGTLWTNAQGDMPNDTWTIGLATLKPTQIAHGLEHMRDSAKPFPPTLPEFIGWCRGVQDGVTALDKQAQRIVDPASLIPRKHTAEEKDSGNSWINAMQVSLHRESKQ